MQTKIQLHRANLTTSLITPVPLPEMTSLESMFDLFAPDEPTHSSLKMRLCTNKDPDDIYVCVRRSEEEDLEHALKELRYDEEIRLAREEEHMRGAGPSK